MPLGFKMPPEKTVDTSNINLFDALFPEKPVVEALPDVPSGPIIESAKGRRYTLTDTTPYTRPLVAGITDPRADDLRADHLAWIKVLGIAFALDGHDPHGIYGLLHCCRSEGANLERRKERLWLLRGEIDGETWGSVYRPRLEERREGILGVLKEGWR